MDREGNVYVGDNASRTLKIGPDGTIVRVLAGIRAHSFSTDLQGNLYLTAGFVSYLVGLDDKLVPNKVDFYSRLAIDYDVTIDSSGTARAVLQVTLTNESMASRLR